MAYFADKNVISQAVSRAGLAVEILTDCRCCSSRRTLPEVWKPSTFLASNAGQGSFYGQGPDSVLPGR